MISRHTELLMLNFTNSLSDPLSADNLFRQFGKYLQENFTDISFALVAHDHSPWPFRILSPGDFAEQALPVLSGWQPKRNESAKNHSFIKIKNLYVFPFRNHQQQVHYILLASLSNIRIRKTIISMCDYNQQLFRRLSQAAQFSAGQMQNTYGIYINNLTHDFNSLLTMISMLRIDEDSVRQKLNYGRMLIREFLYYLKEPELSKVPVEINEVVKAVLQNYTTPIEIINSFPAGIKPIRLMIDVELIGKALQAVLDNAVYFGGLVRGAVQLEISRLKNISPFIEYDWLSLCIRNQGPIIPPEFLERIKEPFFTTLKDQGKIGLGLAIAERIIQTHSGCLTVSNIVNDGVQVTIYLPWEERYA